MWSEHSGGGEVTPSPTHVVLDALWWLLGRRDGCKTIGRRDERLNHTRLLLMREKDTNRPITGLNWSASAIKTTSRQLAFDAIAGPFLELCHGNPHESGQKITAPDARHILP